MTTVFPRPSSDRPYSAPTAESVRSVNAGRFTRKFTNGPCASAERSHSSGSNAFATRAAIAAGGCPSDFANGKHGSERSPRSRSFGTVTAASASRSGSPALAAARATATSNSLTGKSVTSATRIGGGPGAYGRIPSIA